jgi:hypothetical protein
MQESPVLQSLQSGNEFVRRIRTGRHCKTDLAVAEWADRARDRASLTLIPRKKRHMTE